ncbi:MAG: hypothetical protein HUU22_04650 [Phycisphaerae bacterium]|nr:hypothetical protein [Phycisphaerae bacterium]NUQ45303.1 hypothetical protein [Phycisphaerae bacterium]
MTGRKAGTWIVAAVASIGLFGAAIGWSDPNAGSPVMPSLAPQQTSAGAVSPGVAASRQEAGRGMELQSADSLGRVELRPDVAARRPELLGGSPASLRMKLRDWAERNQQANAERLAGLVSASPTPPVNEQVPAPSLAIVSAADDGGPSYSGSTLPSDAAATDELPPAPENNGFQPRGDCNTNGTDDAVDVTGTLIVNNFLTAATSGTLGFQADYRGQIRADDFTLAAATTIRWIKFEGTAIGDTAGDLYRIRFWSSIMTADAPTPPTPPDEKPNTIEYTEDAVPAQIIIEGVNPAPPAGNGATVYRVNLLQPVTLGAGRHWLQVSYAGTNGGLWGWFLNTDTGIGKRMRFNGFNLPETWAAPNGGPSGNTGAHRFQLWGGSLDNNNNGQPDECEDCNTNGTPDGDETGPDCNGNNIPDECELVGNDCNSNGTPDECETDCDGNGVPDDCDLLTNDCNNNGTVDDCEMVDCNLNGVLDECDILGGTSLDCNSNLVPDDCELFDNLHEYVWDDGTQETSIGFTGGATMMWFNEFEVVAGAEIITEVRARFGTPLGAAATLFIWTDPNDDGLPIDAVLVQTVNITTADLGSNIFNRYPVPPTFVGNAGERFFVGFRITHAAAQFPAAIDQTDPDNRRSWILVGSDPNDLTGAALIDDLAPTLAGDWLIRAIGGSDNDCNGNGIPDECDIAAGEPDLNGNGVPDVCEDCNENGTPDPLEPGYDDCNNNNVADFCEIAGGTATDCNNNDVPDECEPDCNTNGVADECDTTGGTSDDCDSNGVPDDCDPDCNTNGTPDGCESGADCNTNNVPDECELVDDSSPILYAIDDGTQNNSIGLTAGGDMIWYNRFNVASGGQYLTTIRVRIAGPFGAPASLHVWSDPNDDNNPIDAVLISSTPIITAPAGVSGFVDYEVSPVFLGNVGETFYVGVLMNHAAGDFPASIDETDPDNRQSWITVSSDPNDLSGSALIDDLGLPGDWMIRAIAGVTNDCNENGTPDECDIDSGASEDANSNGIPDECEDCNNNGTPDLDEPGYVDCNNNDILDECDIAAGFSQDCNSNGIPDECDVADGATVLDSGPGDLDLFVIPNEVGGVFLAHSEVADDFTVSEPSLISFGSFLSLETKTGDAAGPYGWSGFVVVSLYADVGGRPSDDPILVFTTFPTARVDVGDTTGGIEGDIYAYEVPIFVNILVPGTYWINFRPTADTGTGLAFALNAQSATNGNVAGNEEYFRSSSFTDLGAWTPSSDADVLGEAHGMAFALIIESADCNANGVPDECDIAGGSSVDCDNDGMPDECQPDCNGNGTADSCDISGGFSDDVDNDGVPDECEGDCNTNGTPDDADIGSGDSEDCNTNGIPDECDIADNIVSSLFAQFGSFPTFAPFSDSTCSVCASGAQALADDVSLSADSLLTGIIVRGGHDAVAQPDGSLDEFTIQVWSDDFGVPGVVAHTEVIPVGQITRDDLGDGTFIYTLELASPVALSRGVHWVEVVYTGTHSEDWFWLVEDGSVLNYLVFDTTYPATFPNVFASPDHMSLILTTASLDDDSSGIPDECEGVVACATCAGDTDASNSVDGDDVQGFVECLISGTNCGCTDMDGDGSTADADSDDLPMFVDTLLNAGGPCP